MNTNFFFLKLFGRRRDIPAKSRDILPKKHDFPGFEGHTEPFGPRPFGSPPPHWKISGLKSLGLWHFMLFSRNRQDDNKNVDNKLGPVKPVFLRGTPRTCAIKTRAVTDNSTIKKGPRKWNGGPVKGTDGSVRGTEGPATGIGAPLIAQNPFNCARSSYGFNCRAARGSLRKAQCIGFGRT